MKIKQVVALPFGSRNYIFYALTLILVICVGCSGVGSGGSDEPAAAIVIVEPDLTLFAAQRSVDIYRATNADKAIVFLHGGGGTKHNFAYQLGINHSIYDSDYDSVNKQMLLDNRVVLAFPQGEAVREAPLAYTWSNYVMDSGQDDIRFLRDLVGFIAAQYNISKFYLVGHSNGGMMVNRIWCEASDLFEGYVAIAGPPSTHFLNPLTSCSPAQVKPYLGIVGSRDDILQNIDNWDAQTWEINPLVVSSSAKAFVDPFLIGERYFLSYRVMQSCGESVESGDASAVKAGAITTWSFCNNSIKLMRVESGEHSLESLESSSGHNMMELVFDFII